MISYPSVFYNKSLNGSEAALLANNYLTFENFEYLQAAV